MGTVHLRRPQRSDQVQKRVEEERGLGDARRSVYGFYVALNDSGRSSDDVSGTVDNVVVVLFPL